MSFATILLLSNVNGIYNQRVRLPHATHTPTTHHTLWLPIAGLNRLFHLPQFLSIIRDRLCAALYALRNINPDCPPKTTRRLYCTACRHRDYLNCL